MKKKLSKKEKKTIKRAMDKKWKEKKIAKSVKTKSVRSHRMFFKLHKWSRYIPKKSKILQNQNIYHFKND